MSIKSILSAYSGEAQRGAGLRHAIRLALHHDAHLTGVLRHGRPMLERRFSSQIPESLLTQIREADARLIDEVRDRFDSITSEAGLTGRTEFLDLDPADGVALTDLAHCYDLIVTGVSVPDAGDAHLVADPSSLALKSGRPVLVVPDGYDAGGLADHALVAWDGKRSAARALGDAMGVLEEKARVTVLTVGGKAPPPVPPGGGVLTQLQRHSIAAEALHKTRDGRSIAKVIEDTADEVGARLIVMGAYEHAKFGQDLFGGVTSEILRTVQVPVFMSH